MALPKWMGHHPYQRYPQVGDVIYSPWQPQKPYVVTKIVSDTMEPFNGVKRGYRYPDIRRIRVDAVGLVGKTKKPRPAVTLTNVDVGNYRYFDALIEEHYEKADRHAAARKALLAQVGMLP